MRLWSDDFCKAEEIVVCVCNVLAQIQDSVPAWYAREQLCAGEFNIMERHYFSRLYKIIRQYFTFIGQKYGENWVACKH